VSKNYLRLGTAWGHATLNTINHRHNYSLQSVPARLAQLMALVYCRRININFNSNCCNSNRLELAVLVTNNSTHHLMFWKVHQKLKASPDPSLCQARVCLPTSVKVLLGSTNIVLFRPMMDQLVGATSCRASTRVIYQEMLMNSGRNLHRKNSAKYTNARANQPLRGAEVNLQAALRGTELAAASAIMRLLKTQLQTMMNTNEHLYKSIHIFHIEDT
jgi:hypothetical protein